MTNFEPHLIKSLGEFQLYEKQWDELYAASLQHLAVGRHALVAAFWQHFHTDQAVEIACVIDAHTGDLAAALPLVKRNLLRVVPVATTFSNPWCLGFAGMCSAKYEASTALAHLLRCVEMGGYQMVTLDLVSNENCFVTQVQNGATQSNREIRTIDLFPVGKTVLTTSWDEFTQDWSKKRRRFIRRATQQLSDIGDLRLVKLHEASWSEVEAGWQVCQEIEQAGWKGSNGTSVAENPAAAKFFAELVKQLYRSGELRFYLLQLAGRVIAYDLGYLHHRVATSLKVSYHPEFATSSPGHVLNSLVIQDFIESQAADWIDTVGELNDANAKWCRASYRCQKVEVGLSGWSSRNLVRSRDWLRNWKRRWLSRPANDPTAHAPDAAVAGEDG
jgi:CelD/BcsL family acetyltransferase involved in cellulose biosynthesis